MDMNFNGQGNSGEEHQEETFRIREYVAEARRKDWRICWPFHSFGSPRVSIRRLEVALTSESPVTLFSCQSGPINIETSDNILGNFLTLLNARSGISNAQQAQYETREEAVVPVETHEATTPIEVEENMTAGPSNDGAKRTMRDVNDKSRRKPWKYVSLSGLLKELHGP